MTPISGYAGTTIDSKSFSKSSKWIFPFFIKSGKLIVSRGLSKIFLNFSYAHDVLINNFGITNKYLPGICTFRGFSILPIPFPI